MKDVSMQVETACDLCSSKYCVGCKITVRQEDRRITVNGQTRKIERVERIPNFV